MIDHDRHGRGSPAIETPPPASAYAATSRAAIPTYLELMQMHEELDAGDVGSALRQLRAKEAHRQPPTPPPSQFTATMSDRDLAAQALALRAPRAIPGLVNVSNQRAGTLDGGSTNFAYFPNFARSNVAASGAASSRSTSASGAPVLFSERKKLSSTARLSSDASSLSRPEGLRAQLDVMRLDAAETLSELRNIHAKHLGVPL